MSEDIIRSTKEHEVVIPEGSINAKSKSSSVGVAAVEPEHLEKADTANVVIDRRVAVDEAAPVRNENIALPPDEVAGENRVRLPASSEEDNRILLPGESIDDHRIPVVTDVVEEGNTLMLPPEEALASNRVKLPADVSDLSDPSLDLNEDVSSHAHDSPSDLMPSSHGNSQHQTQVAASLADIRREEFVGRVVKLRDEVDQLNQRLDQLQK